MKNHNFNKRKKIGFVLFILVAIFLLPYIVMLLWNALFPAIIGVKTITYLQAAGIFVLSKILFGGFRFGGNYHRKSAMMNSGFKEKLMNMTDEEKTAFKQKWRERCGRKGC